MLFYYEEQTYEWVYVKETFIRQIALEETIIVALTRPLLISMSNYSSILFIALRV